MCFKLSLSRPSFMSLIDLTASMQFSLTSSKSFFVMTYASVKSLHLADRHLFSSLSSPYSPKYSSFPRSVMNVEDYLWIIATLPVMIKYMHSALSFSMNIKSSWIYEVYSIFIVSSLKKSSPKFSKNNSLLTILPLMIS